MSGAFKKDWVYWMAGWLAMCLPLLLLILSFPSLPIRCLPRPRPPRRLSRAARRHNRCIQGFSHFLMDLVNEGVEKADPLRIQLVRSIIPNVAAGRGELGSLG